MVARGGLQGGGVAVGAASIKGRTESVQGTISDVGGGGGGGGGQNGVSQNHAVAQGIPALLWQSISGDDPNDLMEADRLKEWVNSGVLVYLVVCVCVCV